MMKGDYPAKYGGITHVPVSVLRGMKTKAACGQRCIRIVLFSL